jgi:hypothetical protein
MAAEMKIELWDIDRPKDYPGNARKWSGRAIDKVGTSIKTYGWRQPIVVDKHEVIVIGHLRRTAGRSIGETQCPVHVAHDLTATQIRGLRLADNRTNEESDWDIALLAAEFGELQALDFDLTLTGFDAREIDAFTLQPNAAEDDVPPVPATPVSRLGDLWLCGSHRVLCGSATSESDVARLLEDRKPFLMITDPPYGIELDSEWRDRAGLNGHLTSNQSGAARKAKNLADPANRAEPSYMKHRTAGITKPRFPATPLRTGPPHSISCPVSRSPMSGTHRSTPAKCSRACCALDSSTTNRSSGQNENRPHQNAVLVST